MPLGRRDATFSSLAAVAVMHQPQVELGLGREAQLVEGCEVGVVIALDRHRDMHPVDAALNRLGNWVEDRHARPAVLGLDEVLVLVVAVAQVKAEFDVVGHGRGVACQALGDPFSDR